MINVFLQIFICGVSKMGTFGKKNSAVLLFSPVYHYLRIDLDKIVFG